MIEKSPNATRLADKLIAKGFVERKRSEADRRVVYLAISDKGIELLDRKANAIDATMQRQSRYIKKASFSLGASLFITLFLLPLESPCQTTDNNKSSKDKNKVFLYLLIIINLLFRLIKR